MKTLNLFHAFYHTLLTEHILLNFSSIFLYHASTELPVYVNKYILKIKISRFS